MTTREGSRRKSFRHSDIARRRGRDQFQSAPPCRGDRRTSSADSPSRRFNPRPRVGGDLRFRRLEVRRDGVSIRAPV